MKKYGKSVLTSVSIVMFGLTSTMAMSAQKAKPTSAESSGAMVEQRQYGMQPDLQEHNWTLEKVLGGSQSMFRQLKKDAEAGNVQAQYVLGMLYGERDEVIKAMDWLDRAASHGHKKAIFAYSYYQNRDENEYGLGC